MIKDLTNTAFLGLAFLTLFGIAELLYSYFKIKVEVTRKIVHTGTGLLALLFPLVLGNHWLVFTLCFSFAIILVISLKTHMLNSINGIDRKSYGSLLYPLSVYICYLCFDIFDQQYIYFYLPILILAISDPLAALIGKKYEWFKYKIGKEYKTGMGSAAFFLSAFIISTIITFTFYDISIWQVIMAGLVLSVLPTFAEGLSTGGKDNLSIPLSVILALMLCERIIF